MSPTLELLELVRQSDGLLAWRHGALRLLQQTLFFDRALFHELSPRVPLERAAVVGTSREAVEATRKHWDDSAVVLGKLRELALANAGVATDREAFPPGSRKRKQWMQRVAMPLDANHVAAAHLVVQRRVVSVVLLGRSRGRAFLPDEIRELAALVPALAVADALQQTLHTEATRGVPTHLECVDQRLTARQRALTTLVARGHTNTEIGRALGLSAHTIRNHLVRIRERLGAANRAELVRLAVFS